MKINKKLCMRCGGCVGVCPNLALDLLNGVELIYNEEKCVKCRICETFCPVGAIKFENAGGEVQ